MFVMQNDSVAIRTGSGVCTLRNKMADRVELFKRLCVGAEFNREQFIQDMESIRVWCMHVYVRVSVNMAVCVCITANVVVLSIAAYLLPPGLFLLRVLHAHTRTHTYTLHLHCYILIRV